MGVLLHTSATRSIGSVTVDAYSTRAGTRSLNPPVPHSGNSGRPELAEQTGAWNEIPVAVSPEGEIVLRRSAENREGGVPA
jgi:hypothetical protein